MTDLEQKITKLFKAGEDANTSLRAIDMSDQFDKLLNVENLSKSVFYDLSSIVNSFGTKDLRKDITDRKMLLKVFYLVLKSLYLFSQKGIMTYTDARCVNSTELSVMIIEKQDYYNRFGNKNNWMRNDKIFYKGVMMGIRSAGVHPTLMQNIVRCLTQTLTYSDIKGQPVEDYLQRFESQIMYYLVNGPVEERIYLDFI